MTTQFVPPPYTPPKCLLWIDDAREVVSQCAYPDYKFHVNIDGRGDVYLQATYFDADTRTGDKELQYTRRWFLSPKMNKSEIVQTAFKCILTSMDHRAREWFTWKDRAILHPHYDIDKLYEICETREVR